MRHRHAPPKVTRAVWGVLAAIAVFAAGVAPAGSNEIPSPPGPSLPATSSGDVTPKAMPPDGAVNPLYVGAPWFEPGKPYADNFPDPTVVLDGNVYYAYSTSTGGPHLPVMRSTNLNNWEALTPNDAMPTPPTWAHGADQWAPGVARIQGRWVAYTSWEVRPGRRCISAASAASPAGPFVDNRSTPLQCDPDPAGSIDAEPFIDANGTPYLLWKSEGVPGMAPTRLWSRQLRPDGLGFAPGSSPRLLLTTRLGWEQPIIENPSMILHGGVYWLVYSAGDWASPGYATGVARCAGPLGPCWRSRSTPLPVNNVAIQGGGGGSLVQAVGGQLVLVYHAWNRPFASYPTNPNCDGPGLCASQGQRRMYWSTLVPRGGTLTMPLEQLQAPPCPLRDLPPQSYFNHPACWLSGIAVTTGWGGDRSRFEPAASVTRAQMAAFLWRMGAEPAATNQCGFVDLAPTSYAARPACWLKTAGITTGWAGDPSRYNPNAVVTRAQMAAFLWRNRGQPAAPASCGFADVPPGSYYASAACWLKAAGITTGWAGDPSRYNPNAVVTRAQMAAFLWRFAGMPFL